jgi:tetratricopeptide (TPR) repeat protein
MQTKELTKIEQITKVFDLIKSGAIALASVTTVVLFMTLFYSAFTWHNTILEPIQVPEVLSSAGYTSEVVTKRVLDEITKINFISDKHNKKLNIKQPGDELAKLDSIPLAGTLDVRALKTFIQDLFGITHEKMTGEITAIKEDGKLYYGVKVRLMPQDKMLVDLNESVPISQLIHMTALSIVQIQDPAVAATYLRTHNEDKMALIMVAKVLEDDDPSEHAYALTAQAHIYLKQQKFILAQESLTSGLRLDPKFAPAIALQIRLFLYQKKFQLAFEWAQKEELLYPEKWQTYLNLGDAYEGLSKMELAAKAYDKALTLKPSSPVIYGKISDFFDSQGKTLQADAVLKKGLDVFPNDSASLIKYAKILTKEARNEEASEALIKAYELNGELNKLYEGKAKPSTLDKAVIGKFAEKFIQMHKDAFNTKVEDAVDDGSITTKK